MSARMYCELLKSDLLRSVLSGRYHEHFHNEESSQHKTAVHLAPLRDCLTHYITAERGWGLRQPRMLRQHQPRMLTQHQRLANGLIGIASATAVHEVEYAK